MFRFIALFMLYVVLVAGVSWLALSIASPAKGHCTFCVNSPCVTSAACSPGCGCAFDGPGDPMGVCVGVR